MSSAAVERAPTICFLHAPIGTLLGETFLLGRADFANGYRPDFRGLLITRLVMSGNVTTTDADDMELEVLIDGTPTVLCSLTFPRTSGGWNTVVATPTGAYIRPNDDASPQWITIRLLPDSLGGVISNASISVFGEWLWA